MRGILINAMKSVLVNKIFIRYSKLFFLSVIVPLSIACVGMMVSFGNSMDENIKNNNLMLEQISKGFAREFNEIQQKVLDIALDEDISNYKYGGSAESIIQLKNIATKTITDDSSKNFILGIYIFMASEEIIIYDGAKYTVPQFYNAVISKTGESFESWFERMNQVHYINYECTDKLFPYKAEDKRIIELIQSYPLEKESALRGNVVALIDYDNITKYYCNISGSDSAVYVTNGKGDIIYSIGSETYALRDEYLELGDGESMTGELSSIVMKVTQSGYNFICITRNGLLARGFGNILVFNIICIILFVVLMLISVITSAYKVSKPVIELESAVKKLGFDESGDMLNNKKNGKWHDVLISSLEKGSEAVKAIQPMIKNNVLKRLFENRIIPEQDIRTELAEVGVVFDKSDYVVIIICIITKVGMESKETAYLKYVVSESITKYLKKLGNAVVVDNDWNRFSVILNIENEEGLYDKLTEQLKIVCNAVSPELAVELEINIGGINSGVSNVFKSWKEANECFEYRIYGTHNQIFSYPMIRNQKNKYLYSTDMENELMRNIIAGNERVAIERLDSILKFHENSSAFVIRCLYFNLMGTMFRTLGLWGNEADEHAIIDHYYTELFECKNMKEMYEVSEKIIKDCCKNINSGKTDKRSRFKILIMDYVNNHYCDNSISLESIADEFNVDITYISHFFREQIGENFSDYISRQRIEKTKQLLRETNLTIGEIAIRVGYANSTVLIRRFKRQEGITPGVYREANSEQF